MSERGKESVIIHTNLLIFGSEMMVLCGSSSPGSEGGGGAGVTTRFLASSFSCSVSTK